MEIREEEGWRAPLQFCSGTSQPLSRRWANETRMRRRAGFSPKYPLALVDKAIRRGQRRLFLLTRVEEVDAAVLLDLRVAAVVLPNEQTTIQRDAHRGLASPIEYRE